MNTRRKLPICHRYIGEKTDISKSYKLIGTMALAGVLLAAPGIAAALEKTYCYIDQDQCERGQKQTTGGSKSGCYQQVKDGERTSEWCFDWDSKGNPDNKEHSVDLGTLLLDPEFEDAYIMRLQDVVDKNRQNDIGEGLERVQPTERAPNQLDTFTVNR